MVAAGMDVIFERCYVGLLFLGLLGLVFFSCVTNLNDELLLDRRNSMWDRLPICWYLTGGS
jgi:hypothetical protein